MIEFALVLPLLVLLMIGGIDLAHMAYDNVIVDEAMNESAKLSMDESNGSTITNAQLLDWMRQAAHTADPSIAPGDIQAPAQGDDGVNPWEFDGKQFDQVRSAVSPAAGTQGTALGGLNATPDPSYSQAATAGSAGCNSHLGADWSAERFVNPGLQTMRVVYSFNTGVGRGVGIPITHKRAFTAYEFLMLPIPEPGCVR